MARSGLFAAAAVLCLDVAFAEFNLTLLHINDHHSHLDSLTVDFDGDRMGLSTSGQVVRMHYAGWDRLVSGFEYLMEEAEAKGSSVMKLHAGDAMTGTSYFSLFRGMADAHMMSHVCFDAFEVGNHEFDTGDQTLADFIHDLNNHTALCGQTPVLGANVVPGPTSPLEGLIQKSTIKTLNGERVGVVGIDVKVKTMGSSSPSHGTTLTDEAPAAQAEIDVLIAAGVNKIVLLTHVGYEQDTTMMAALRGVDVIIGGDSHSLLGDERLAMVGWNKLGDYPTELTNGDGKKVCVVQAWEYAKAIGSLDVTFDDAGDVLHCGGSPRFMYDNTSMIYRSGSLSNQPVSDTDLAAVNVWLATHGDMWVPMTPDSAAAADLSSWKDQVDGLKQQIIATVPTGLCFDRFPGQGLSAICDAALTLEHGGAACQLVSKAFLSVSLEADIAIQNGGGCRTDITQGDYTHDDAYTMLPFANTLVNLEMTGTQIKTVLEQALAYALSSSSGAYPYASGIRFKVNVSAAEGSRISDLEVNSRLAGSWAPISDGTTYKVVSNNYIAGGRDGYTEFSSASAMVDTYIEYAEGLVLYARAQGTLIAPPITEFSTQGYTDASGVCHSACPVVQTTTMAVTTTIEAMNDEADSALPLGAQALLRAVLLLIPAVAGATLAL